MLKIHSYESVFDIVVTRLGLELDGRLGNNDIDGRAPVVSAARHVIELVHLAAVPGCREHGLKQHWTAALLDRTKTRPYVSPDTQ